MGANRTFDLIDRRASGPFAQPANNNKLLGLELLRFVCALAVLFWHYRHFYRTVGAPDFVQTAQPWYAPFALFYDYGLFGVQLFWGISGFIFFWKYGQAIRDRTVTGAQFFWLRFSRLYPLHFATLILVAALQPIHVALTAQSFIVEDNTLPKFVGQLFMATHWWGRSHFSFNGPIWSVSAEVLVYALFFILVRRFGADWRLIGCALAASLVSQAIGLVSPALLCACHFFAGGAAARLHLDAQGTDRATVQERIAGLTVLGIAGFFWSADSGLVDQMLPFMLLVATPPLLLVVARDWRLLDVCQGPVRVAGNLTYSTYLIHFPIQLMIAIGCAATGVILPLQSPLFLVGYLGVTIIFGRWLFDRFERPAQSWIRRRVLRRTALAV